MLSTHLVKKSLSIEAGRMLLSGNVAGGISFCREDGTAFERSGGAAVQAIAAADTFGTVGVLIDRKPHLAGVLTGAATGASIGIDLEADSGDRIEQSVDGAERAEIAAEGAPDPQREQDEQEKDGDLPGVEPSRQCLQRLVHHDERQSGHQGLPRPE